MQSMVAHVQAHMPLEACGLLAGKNSRVEKIIPVRNQAQSPKRYVMDPVEQLNAFEWIDTNGLELLGIFHSHPAGPEEVSPTDIEEAAYAVVYVILAYTTETWHARGFWITEGTFEEIPLQIE